jgi:hypothetical protein
MVALLFVLVGIAWRPPVARPSGEGGDLADILMTRDLVIEGTVVEAVEHRRSMAGGCTVSQPLGPYMVLDVRIDVSRVVAGLADDSTVVISMLGGPQYVTGPLVSGTQVVAWADRACDDGWRLWGSACVLISGRVVVPGMAEVTIDGVLGSDFSYEVLVRALGARRTMAPASPYDGAAAVGLVQVAGITRAGKVARYSCDSLGWVVGGAARLPTTLVWRNTNLCTPGARVGDSLLVPIRENRDGSKQTLTSCPRGLLIRNGFLESLGVPIGSLHSAVYFEDARLRLRAFVARD